jgi:hypothetical protein
MQNILTKITSVFDLQLYQHGFTPKITCVTHILRPLRLTKVHTEISLLIDVSPLHRLRVTDWRESRLAAKFHLHHHLHPTLPHGGISPPFACL